MHQINIQVLAKEGEKIEIQIRARKELASPVLEGEVCGEVSFWLSEVCLGTYPIYPATGSRQTRICLVYYACTFFAAVICRKIRRYKMSRLDREKLMVVFPTTTDAMHMQQAATKYKLPGTHDTASRRTRGWMWACMVHIARTKKYA